MIHEDYTHTSPRDPRDESFDRFDGWFFEEAACCREVGLIQPQVRGLLTEVCLWGSDPRPLERILFSLDAVGCRCSRLEDGFEALSLQSLLRGNAEYVAPAWSEKCIRPG